MSLKRRPYWTRPSKALVDKTWWFLQWWVLQPKKTKLLTKPFDTMGSELRISCAYPNQWKKAQIGTIHAILNVFRYVLTKRWSTVRHSMLDGKNFLVTKGMGARSQEGGRQRKWSPLCLEPFRWRDVPWAYILNTIMSQHWHYFQSTQPCFSCSGQFRRISFNPCFAHFFGAVPRLDIPVNPKDWLIVLHFAYFLGCNLRIVQPIWGLLCKAWIQGCTGQFMDHLDPYFVHSI